MRLCTQQPSLPLTSLLIPTYYFLYCSVNGADDIEHVAIGNEAFGENDIEGKAAKGSGE
jgi:hypothetical protein